MRHHHKHRVRDPRQIPEPTVGTIVSKGVYTQILGIHEHVAIETGFPRCDLMTAIETAISRTVYVNPTNPLGIGAWEGNTAGGRGWQQKLEPRALREVGGATAWECSCSQDSILPTIHLHLNFSPVKMVSVSDIQDWESIRPCWFQAQFVRCCTNSCRLTPSRVCWHRV